MIKYFFEDIFWIWFNLTGFVLTFVLALVVSSIFKTDKHQDDNVAFVVKKEDIFTKEVLILVIFFVAILTFSFCIPSILATIH
jgi:hypothetical protein